MEVLIVLTCSFVISLVVLKIARGKYDFALSGRIAMASMLVFTGIGHFIFPKGMSMMLPSFVPLKLELIYFTGILEILAAVGLIVSKFRVVTGWLLIIFFVLILPANIYAALNHIDYQNGTNNGYGPAYLWFRIPLQILFIVWIYFSVVKKLKTNGKPI